MHARYYDPFLARFTQADTIVPEAGNPQGLNRFAYTRNNPVLYTDPSGHTAGPPVILGAGGRCPSCELIERLPPVPPEAGFDPAHAGAFRWAYGVYWSDPERYATNLAIYDDASAYFIGMTYSEDYLCNPNDKPVYVPAHLGADAVANAVVTQLPTIMFSVGAVFGSKYSEAHAYGTTTLEDLSAYYDDAFLAEQRALQLQSPSNSGKPYPTVIDPRTGDPIPFPQNPQRVPKDQRVQWDSRTDRGAFITKWYDQGYSTPPGGWGAYDIHHIDPKEFGGNNSFWNLVPVYRPDHQQQLTPWWNAYNPN
jgi:hypothetical protein